MKKSTHSKLKNTALLFELLTRQIASDTVKGTENSPALDILKEFFNKKTALAKELTLYQTLLNERMNHPDKADYLINTVVSLRNKLIPAQLSTEKYKLIAEVKKHYDLKEFFKTVVNDYRTCAAIYRVFEGASVSKAAEVVRSRFTISEHITQKSSPKDEQGPESKLYMSQDDDVRILAYKLMLEKFNEKYQGLSVRQKGLLREYIGNVSNTVTLKQFVIKEAALLKKALKKRIVEIENPVAKIKVTEVCNLLEQYSEIKTVKEEHILSLLLHYELLKELRNVNN